MACAFEHEIITVFKNDLCAFELEDSNVACDFRDRLGDESRVPRG